MNDKWVEIQVYKMFCVNIGIKYDDMSFNNGLLAMISWSDHPIFNIDNCINNNIEYCNNLYDAFSVFIDESSDSQYHIVIKKHIEPIINKLLNHLVHNYNKK